MLWQSLPSLSRVLYPKLSNEILSLLKKKKHLLHIDMQIRRNILSHVFIEPLSTHILTCFCFICNIYLYVGVSIFTFVYFHLSMIS